MTREEAIAELSVLHERLSNPKDCEDGCYSWEDGWYVEALNMAIEALLAEVTQGEWVDEDGNKVPLDKDGYPLGSCWCNQCHEWLVGSDEYYTKGNFCPSCGAKMKNGG